MTTGRINQVTFVRRGTNMTNIGEQIIIKLLAQATTSIRSTRLYTKASPLPLTGVGRQAGRVWIQKTTNVTARFGRHPTTPLTQRGELANTVRSLWFLCTFPRPRLVQMQRCIRPSQ